MEKGKIIVIAGIVLFCLWLILNMTLSIVPLEIDFSSISIFLDMPSLLFVVFGGSALAFIKMPKNKKDFLKYFSRTAILAGMISFIIGLMRILWNFPEPVTLMANLSAGFVTIFYGLIFSGIAYALCCDE